MNNTKSKSVWSRRLLLVGALGLVLCVWGGWAAFQSTVRVGVVVYNEGGPTLYQIDVSSGDETQHMDELQMDQSRLFWFHPSEDPTILRLNWHNDSVSLQEKWELTSGERLTVRLGRDGLITSSRSRSLGRQFIDLIGGEP